MAPAGNPAKSAASQPLVDVLGVGPGGICTSTKNAVAVTSPGTAKLAAVAAYTAEPGDRLWSTPATPAPAARWRRRR